MTTIALALTLLAVPARAATRIAAQRPAPASAVFGSVGPRDARQARDVLLGRLPGDGRLAASIRALDLRSARDRELLAPVIRASLAARQDYVDMGIGAGPQEGFDQPVLDKASSDVETAVLSLVEASASASEGRLLPALARMRELRRFAAFYAPERLPELDAAYAKASFRLADLRAARIIASERARLRVARGARESEGLAVLANSIQEPRARAATLSRRLAEAKDSQTAAELADQLRWTVVAAPADAAAQRRAARGLRAALRRGADGDGIVLASLEGVARVSAFPSVRRLALEAIEERTRTAVRGDSLVHARQASEDLKRDEATLRKSAGAAVRGAAWKTLLALPPILTAVGGVAALSAGVASAAGGLLAAWPAIAMIALLGLTGLMRGTLAGLFTGLIHAVPVATVIMMSAATIGLTAPVYALALLLTALGVIGTARDTGAGTFWASVLIMLPVLGMMGVLDAYYGY